MKKESINQIYIASKNGVYLLKKFSVFPVTLKKIPAETSIENIYIEYHKVPHVVFDLKFSYNVDCCKYIKQRTYFVYNKEAFSTWQEAKERSLDLLKKEINSKSALLRKLKYRKVILLRAKNEKDYENASLQI